MERESQPPSNNFSSQYFVSCFSLVEPRIEDCVLAINLDFSPDILFSFTKLLFTYYIGF